MSKKTTDKPTSPAKLAANKANAAKSTGPKTPEGKARSSQNALKHGLLSRHLILPGDDAEQPEDFERLHNELIAEYRPVTPTQRLLVERMAICYWRLQRVIRYETQSVVDSRGNPAGAVAEQLFHKMTGLNLPQPTVVLPPGPEIDHLIRYETMIDRQLNRILDRLDHLPNTGSAEPDRVSVSSSPPVSASPHGPATGDARHSGLGIRSSDFIRHSDFDIRHSAPPTPASPRPSAICNPQSAIGIPRRLADGRPLTADSSFAPNEPTPAPPNPLDQLPQVDIRPPGIAVVRRI